MSAVAQIGGTHERSHLAAFLKEDSPSIRRSAAMALAELGDARGLQVMRTIRRNERFTPRFLRGARPRAPVAPAAAVVFAASWIAATVAVARETSGAYAWLGQGLVVVACRELWLRLRERAAERRHLFCSERSVKLRWPALMSVYLRAAAVTVIVGFAVSHHAALLSTFS